MSDEDGLIRHCRACGVDVSLPEDAAGAGCPRCGGVLEVPSDAGGDAQDKTLVAVPPSAEPERTERVLLDVPREVRPSADLQPLSPEDESPSAASDPTLLEVPPSSDSYRFEDTATQPGGSALRPTTRTLGPYELVRVLGKGGMGVVYEAYQPSLGRTVALKVMSAAEAGEEELARFDREARAAAKLQHPNIVPIYEVGQVDGRNYFTMELVRGRTLQALARAGELTPEESARLVGKVAHAIQFAHDQGIIHRDLKPSNILVDLQGEPHVMDFGLAKDQADLSGLTLTGVAMGSPPYMPPEQARGEFRQVDAISDVYGLGACLYECLTGGPPFTGKSLYDIIAQVLVEEPTPPRRKNPAVPYDLETVCLKALEKEKWRRYARAADLAQDLERFVAGRTIHAIRQGFTTRIGRGIQRHRTQIFTALLPLAVVAALLAHLGIEQPGEGPGRRVLPPRPEVVDPLARAIEELSARQERTALSTLMGTVEAEALPPASELLATLAPLPEAAARELRRRVEAEVDGQLERRLPPDRLGVLLGDLILREEEVPPRLLGELTSRWLAGAGERTVRLVRQAVLTARGADTREAEPYRLALAGPPTPLDPAVRLSAATWVEPPPEDAPWMAPAPRPPPRLEDREVRARRERTRWSFPRVRLPVRDDPQWPAAPGLFGPGSDPWQAPTRPLRTPDGQRVVVGWLRFLYVLDDADGRVLRRQRLPGLAADLRHGDDGALRLRVFRPVAHYTPPAPTEGEAAPDPAEWRDLVVRVEGTPPAVELTEVDGSPVAPPDLLPLGEAVAPDELRRIAQARFPEFADVVDVSTVDGARGARVKRTVHVHVPPGELFELGFAQERATPLLGATIAEVRDVEARRRGLREGDLLQELILPPPGGEHPFVRLFLKRQREGEWRAIRDVVYRAPYRAPSRAEWQAVAERADEHLRRTRDANPWVQAYGAAARQRAGLDAEELARSAAESPHPSPRERVELGCFLDQHDLTAAADAAFALALREAVGRYGLVRSWAGYGPLDCGQPLAVQADARRRQGDAERAAALARWRDAFAPVLGESRFVQARFPDAAGDAAEPPTGPDLPPEERPYRGIAALDTLDLLRLDLFIRLQGNFLLFLGGLCLILLLRYRRHSVRDLGRIGSETLVERWLLWVKKPWVRLSFSWPTYVALSDKLALVVLYLFYFAAFAVQDAGIEALVALRRDPQTIHAGLPTDRAALRYVDGAFAAHPDDPAIAYSRAWLRHARGLPVEEVREAYRDALTARRDARTLLGLAELVAGEGDVSKARELLDKAAELEPDRLEVALLRARLDGEGLEALLPLARSRSPRLALALRATGRLPTPLAPPPAAAERDVLLMRHRTTRWWESVPDFLLRDLFVPTTGQADASLTAFEKVWDLNQRFVRLRNEYFWLVPGSLLLIVASLFLRTPRWFEPLESDLAPPPLVRLLALFFPGVPQFMRGRPVRGVLLLAPWVTLAQTLYHGVVLDGTTILGRQWEFSHLDAPQIGALTAEVPSAVPFVTAYHHVELALALAALYLLHWLDLALTRRKRLRGAAGDAGRRPRDASAPLIVDVDSEPASGPLRATGARPTRDPDESLGPFDETEPQEK